MFFQFSPPAPKQHQPKKKDEKKVEAEEIEVLSLAPFTPNPKLAFTDIKVGTSATRKLLIKNPFKHDIIVSVTNTIPDEINLSYSWLEVVVPSEGDVVLDLTWIPHGEQSSRHSFIISDGSKINRSIPISFKSIGVKKPKSTGTKPKKKIETSTKTQPKQNKSPIKYSINKRSPIITTKYMKKSPHKKYFNCPTKESGGLSKEEVSPQKTFSNKVVSDSPKKIKQSDKENIYPRTLDETCSSIFVSPSNQSFLQMEKYLDERFEEQRRLTYTIDESIKANLNSPLRTFPKKILKERNESPDALLKSKLTAMTFEEKIQMFQVDTPKKEASPIYKSRFDASNWCISEEIKSHPNLTLDQQNVFGLNTQDFFKRNSGEFKQIYETKSESDLQQTDLNISEATYVIKSQSSANLETFKINLSSETYVVGRDNSIGDITTLTESPVHVEAFERPRMVVSPYETHSLWSIEEESALERSLASKRKSTADYVFSPPKRPALTQPLIDWSKSNNSAFRLARKSSGIHIQKFDKKQTGHNTSLVVTKTESTKLIVQNPFLYANIIDPFLTSDLYCNEEWIKNQENNFKKWLNYLLKPPEEFAGIVDNFDLEKIWQECKKRDVFQPQTKEEISIRYHTSSRLENLRKEGANLYRSPEISIVLTKLFAAIDADKLKIRDDRDLHLNLSLKSGTLTLIMSYNPLWLRIGLETIYNERLPLTSNSDVFGLSNFVLERLLKDPSLLKKKFKTIYSQKYVLEFKRLFLKRFLSLVYFLDVAKSKKLIPHDPCLFCINSKIKDSRSILINFAKETLAAVGDITKYLKLHGYIVSHTQMYIHEFNYAVKNLGVDLRDGIRLTKVMEIILMRLDLIEQLRVPPISRLQKLHNMKVVFSALENAGFHISDNIDPKDIIDGHREKTLSFLWQIIYKFEAPLMVKHATTIQTWYRSLPIVLKRRSLQKIEKHRIEAATKIQIWYRHLKCAQKFINFANILSDFIKQRKIERAVTTVQAFYRMYICRKKYLTQIQLIIKLQSICRGWLIRNNYRSRELAATLIQKNYRKYILAKKYNRLKMSVIYLQRKFRATHLMKQERIYFVTLKNTAIFIQNRFRNIQVIKKDRSNYLKQKAAALRIQSYYRQYIVRQKYTKLLNATITIQRKYRAFIEFRSVKKSYEILRTATIQIQRYFRARKLMKTEQTNYLKKKKATIIIQSFYRKHIARKKYLLLMKYTVFMQQKFRANYLMKKQRELYLQQKYSAITIQSYYRMYMTRKIFLFYKIRDQAAICIQRRYRAYVAIKCGNPIFGILQQTVTTERKFEEYHKLTSAAVYTHSYIKLHHETYLKLKLLTEKIQTWFNATIEMKKQREYYISLKNSARVIEERYTARKLMLKDSRYYNNLKIRTVLIQQRYRALLMMRVCREEYLHLKKVTVFIQRTWKGKKQTQAAINSYRTLKNTVKIVQRRYRALQLMKCCRAQYVEIKTAIIIIQRFYRARLETKKCQGEYQTIIQATIKIQRFYRGFKQMQISKACYKKLKWAAIVIQRRFRATQLMLISRGNFILMKRSICIIQAHFRAQKSMIKQRNEYQTLKSTTLYVQRRYRANKLALMERNRFLQLKKATIIIQTRYRANILALNTSSSYSKLKLSVLVIQQRFRAYLKMKEKLQLFQKLRHAVLVIQRKWRATIEMYDQRASFLKYRRSVCTIQRYYRAYRMMKIEHGLYLKKRVLILNLQKYIRGYLVRKIYAEDLKPENIKNRQMSRIQNAAAIKIQARWRSYFVRNSNSFEMQAITAWKKSYFTNRGQPHGHKQKTLGQRCELAVEQLVRGDSTLFQITKALEDIDFIVKHCRESRIQMSNILPDMIYLILNSTARSLPEMTACNLASLILISFYKYPQTRENSWRSTHIDHLITVMMHWCDKDAPLFPTLCTLLWLFAHNPVWKEYILNLPNLNQRMEKIKTQVTRKQTMVTRSKSKTQYFGPLGQHKLPSTVTTWGLDYHRPIVFLNSVHAFRCLMKIFDLM